MELLLVLALQAIALTGIAVGLRQACRPPHNTKLPRKRSACSALIRGCVSRI